MNRVHGRCVSINDVNVHVNIKVNVNVCNSDAKNANISVGVSAMPLKSLFHFTQQKKNISYKTMKNVKENYHGL